MSVPELFLVCSCEMPKTEFQMEINLIDAENKWVSNISESLSLIYGALIKCTLGVTIYVFQERGFF